MLTSGYTLRTDGSRSELRGVTALMMSSFDLETFFPFMPQVMKAIRGREDAPDDTPRPASDPSPVIPSDLSFGYLSAELKSPVKIRIPVRSTTSMSSP